MSKVQGFATLQMNNGEFGSGKKPIMRLVPGGKRAYIWVGCDAPDDNRCFAHVSGRARLERFARTILDELAPRPRKKRT